MSYYRRVLTSIVAQAVYNGENENELTDAMLEEIGHIVVASRHSREDINAFVELLRHKLDQKVVDSEHKLRVHRRPPPPPRPPLEPA